MNGVQRLSNALRTETRQRKRRVDEDQQQSKSERPPIVYKASFATAQKKIKKELGVPNTVDGDAYVSIGRCLDEVTEVVVDRWINFLPSAHRGEETGASQKKTLSATVALNALMCMIPTEKHDEVFAFINDSLNAYHGIDQ